MTDRELLELAAKAAGIELKWHHSDGDAYARRNGDYWACWNPLTDDGDALRLAVHLRLAIHHGFSLGSQGAFGVVSVWGPYQAIDQGTVIKDQADRLAATRRAIVEAAVNMGRAMP